MSALETLVVRRRLPSPEGRRKTTVGKMPSQTAKETVDSVFANAQTVIDRFGFAGESGLDEYLWESLLANLQAIHTNSFNSSGLRGKAGYLKRELVRQKRRYQQEFSSQGKGKSKGSAKAKARKAAKSSASRELRNKMRSRK